MFKSMSSNPIKKIRALKSFPWETADPFLFCVHHLDNYPQGNEKMGPVASLAGRAIGQDFQGKDGWNMYHGDVIPGFPQHPHRGFETVTIVRQGLVDHADSLGASARFGRGDVQWITAGKGLSHSEMMPLVNRDKPNPLDLFQIWLNLPKSGKMVEPHFSMLWADAIPHFSLTDSAGRKIEVTLVAGSLENLKAPSPPPKSWAARSENDLAIWIIKLAPHAQWFLPKAQAGLNRTLYFYHGSSLHVEDQLVQTQHAVELQSDLDVSLVNGADETEILLLQGRPIGEPVAQYGPFVMNTQAEIQDAFNEYRKTQFGGWPWKSDAPVHPRDEVRFAKYPDGRIERKED
jgi:quercetin 2,3-dioxygenase